MEMNIIEFKSSSINVHSSCTTSWLALRRVSLVDNCDMEFAVYLCLILQTENCPNTALVLFCVFKWLEDSNKSVEYNISISTLNHSHPEQRAVSEGCVIPIPYKEQYLHLKDSYPQ